MNILAVIGLGLIAAVLAVVLRQVRPEFALVLSLAVGGLILLSLMSDIGELAGRLRSMADTVNVPARYIQVLFKALGICFITQLACDTCKDAGEGAISARIEMAGKIGVLVVSLPLFEQVLAVVRALL